MSNEKSDQLDKENDKTEKEGKKESDSATIADVKQIVSEAVESVKELFNVPGDINVDDDNDNKGEDGEEPKKERRVRRSYATIEADARRMVEEQVKAVLGEVEHKKQHEELKKQPAQKPPIKVRRSTRFWLGKDYGND